MRGTSRGGGALWRAFNFNNRFGGVIREFASGGGGAFSREFVTLYQRKPGSMVMRPSSSSATALCTSYTARLESGHSRDIRSCHISSIFDPPVSSLKERYVGQLHLPHRPVSRRPVQAWTRTRHSGLL